MKKILFFGILILSIVGNSQGLSPSLCSAKDLKNLKFVWTDMENNGFEQARIDKGIGIAAGDCTKPYSLETIAGRTHKMDAPKPACGVILTLSYDEALAAEQAAWVLDTVGTIYSTEEGLSIQICAKISTAGPSPGVTVHN